MRIIAIVNQKGGCGKTTTAINLASVFARRGHRTLLVDMDPQAHCSAGLGVPESQVEFGISDALIADHGDGFDATPLLWEVARNFHLAPSTVRLAAMEAPGGGLHRLPDKDRRLASLLQHVNDAFDVCLIDCPPTIGLLTFNALRAAREALIPVETGFFSLRGAEKQWQTIQHTVNHLGRPMACHMLPTLHDPQSKTAVDVLAALHRQFAGQIVPVVVHEHESLREAATRGQAIVEYAPDSPAHHDFEQLAQWLEEHALRPEIEIEVLHRRDHPAASAHGGERAPSEHGGGRAGELVRRVRDNALRAEDPSVAVETRPQQQRDLSDLYGVRQTSQGVLFVQPAAIGQCIGIAGDFNNWSTSVHKMRFNSDVGVFERIINLPPGDHQYRLVVDGRLCGDPYNDRRIAGDDGSITSLVHVR